MEQSIDYPENQELLNLTLFEKFGGDRNVEILVKLWMQKTKGLNFNERDISGNAELRQEKYIQFMKSLLDGQRFYIGKKLSEAHQDLRITNAKFDEVVQGLSESLKAMNPNIEVYRDILKRVDGLRPMIVH